MTREEAIELLKELWRYERTYKYTEDEIRQALDMAISALSAEPCEDCISRQAVIDSLVWYDDCNKLNADKTIEVIKALPSDVRESRTSEDCKGERMNFPNTFDEFAEQYGFTDKEEVYTNGSHLIPVFRVKQWLEHNQPKNGEPTLEEVTQYTRTHDLVLWTREESEEVIRKLLSAEPKKGEWKYTGDFLNDGMIKCSECGKEVDVSEDFSFCPCCGSRMTHRMRGEHEND